MILFIPKIMMGESEKVLSIQGVISGENEGKNEYSTPNNKSGKTD